MKQKTLTATVAAAFSHIALETANAEEQAKTEGTEKCSIVGYDKAGKELGLIKAGKGDCKTEKNSCTGENKAGEKDAYITVPKGVCERIEGGTVK